MTDAFDYVKANGLCKESDYKYTGRDGTCKKDQCTAVTVVTSYENVKPGDKEAMKEADTIEPVAIAVAASMKWQFYMGGILKCNFPGALNHGVELVGHNFEANDDGYWLVKNSWGTGWGEKGYIRLNGKDSHSACKALDDASYATAS